ncbi:hypothetical protein EJB05_12834, partial [Eragrostis curvula]
MARRLQLVVLPCLLLSAMAAAAAAMPAGDVQSSYIVHVAPAHAPRSKSRLRLVADAYPSFLRASLPTRMLRPEPRVLYSYAHAATGFAARLTRRQAERLASLPSVLAVVPDGARRLQTTRTPHFLGLMQASGLVSASRGAVSVVIGVIDSGVYPEGRASFAALPDTAPPPTFRGGCVSTPTFNGTELCNSKLVGAKFFHKGHEAAVGLALDEAEKSPLDTTGHGTHTASTAAGSAVEGASFSGYAEGKAACWPDTGCMESDVLAAFDEAVADGVRVISVSIAFGAGGWAPRLYEDAVAVASYNAVVRRGIVVSAAAGNEGPGDFTAQNVAPWLLTVGASTIDRQFVANVVLGSSGLTVAGASLYAGAPLGDGTLPLVDGGACEYGSFDAGKVAGKIVVCGPSDYASHTWKGEVVRRAGGAGAVLAGSARYRLHVLPQHHTLPATSVSMYAYRTILSYINSQQALAAATIQFLGTVSGQERTPPSPRVAAFSGRGPNIRAPGILKPDVVAPGESVLASWPNMRASTTTGLELHLDDDDENSLPHLATAWPQFNVMYGTSMACPHASGDAPGGSALMTTAYNLDSAGDVIRDATTGRASTPFARGAGHMDPNRALDPGLVYNALEADYVAFLTCELGYTAKQVALFTKDGGSAAADCSSSSTAATDANYPAFSVLLDGDKVTQRRRVTNVGRLSTTTYSVIVGSPPGVRVTVNPPSLHFMRGLTTKRYEVTFEPMQGAQVTDKYSFGSIVWTDGKHNVTSPIAIIWPPSSDADGEAAAAAI